ncbi:hypothetical protein T439DRAFT_380930 [Meredithblackwellia eburnea MCA 4105]
MRSRKYYKCKLCDKSLEGPTRLKNHYRSPAGHNNEGEAKELADKLEQEAEERKEKKTRATVKSADSTRVFHRFPCQLCDQKFYRKEALVKHYRNPPHNSEDLASELEKMDRAQLLTYNGRTSQARAQDYIPKPKVMEGDEKKFHCKQVKDLKGTNCTSRFKQRKDYNFHYRSTHHNMDVVYPCPLDDCNKKAEKRNMPDHWKIDHKMSVRHDGFGTLLSHMVGNPEDLTSDSGQSNKASDSDSDSDLEVQSDSVPQPYVIEWGGQKTYGCPEKDCELDFPNIQRYRDHFYACHYRMDQQFNCPVPNCNFSCLKRDMPAHWHHNHSMKNMGDVDELLSQMRVPLSMTAHSLSKKHYLRRLAACTPVARSLATHPSFNI